MTSDMSLTLGAQHYKRDFRESSEVRAWGQGCGRRWQLNAPCGPPQAWSTPYPESVQEPVSAIPEPQRSACPCSPMRFGKSLSLTTSPPIKAV